MPDNFRHTLFALSDPLWSKLTRARRRARSLEYSGRAQIATGLVPKASLAWPKFAAELRNVS